MDNKISIIIPSIREFQLTKHSVEASCPIPYELIIAYKRGVAARARNWGAFKAQGKLLVFLDDDITIRPEAWERFLAVNPREFLMYLPLGTPFPCSRVVCIHRRAFFWKVGGFDETFVIGTEDHDFYIRALDKGLTFKPLLPSMIIHHEHPLRTRNIHVAIKAIRENMIFVRRTMGRHHRVVLKVAFIDRLRRRQFVTVLLALYWLFRLGVKI